MAYTVTEGAILEAIVKQTMAGQVLLNTFHYKLHLTGGAVDIDGASAINHFNSLFNGAAGMTPKLNAVQHNTCLQTAVQYQWISPTRYGLVLLDSFAAAGALDGTALPPNDGIAITKRGEKAGRQYIGTVHVGGLEAESFTAGTINGVTLTDFETLRDEVKAVYTYAPGGEQYTPVIYHRADPTNSPVVVGTFLQTTARINRRRTVGLGI